jgi:integrase
MRHAPTADEIAAAYAAVAGRPGDALERGTRAPATWIAYANALRRFDAWCAGRGVPAMPATVSTFREYLLDLADAGRKVSSIRGVASAIIVAHRLRGHPLAREHVRETLLTLRRLYPDDPKQARPILREELKALLEPMAASRYLPDVRDRALLALGWAGALRESEIVALDWQRLGRGRGYVRLQSDSRNREGAHGAVIVLTRSKGAQAAAVRIVVPASDMPTAIEALARWAEVARLKPGAPVFCAIVRERTLTANRLQPNAVARIIRRRIRNHNALEGRTQAEADALAGSASGHSLRAGWITQAAQDAVPEYKIRARARHKSAEQTARYIRPVTEHSDSALRGVGF